MKIFFKMHAVKRSLIFTLLICILFPWSLAAEISQKAPANSLSYFLDNEKNQTTEVSEPVAMDIPPLGFEAAEPARQAAPTIDRTAAIEEMRARLVVANTETKTVDSTANAVDTVKLAPEKDAGKAIKPTDKPVKIKKQKKASQAAAATIVVQTNPAPEEKIAVSAPEKTNFSDTLARMLQNKANRIAEAEKLGVVLPSQGGDIATVSPSLSKMQQTLRSIMSR